MGQLKKRQKNFNIKNVYLMKKVGVALNCYKSTEYAQKIFEKYLRPKNCN